MRSRSSSDTHQRVNHVVDQNDHAAVYKNHPDLGISAVRPGSKRMREQHERHAEGSNHFEHRNPDRLAFQRVSSSNHVDELDGHDHIDQHG